MKTLMSCVYVSRWKEAMRGLFGTLAVMVAFAVSGGGKPVSLKCEYRTDPIGIETVHPRLSWQSGDGQTAWRIRAASTEDRLLSGDADLWDSGRICGRETYGVAYSGKMPMPSQRVYWQVKIWTSEGESDWSCPAKWQWGSEIIYHSCLERV